MLSFVLRSRYHCGDATPSLVFFLPSQLYGFVTEGNEIRICNRIFCDKNRILLDKAKTFCVQGTRHNEIFVATPKEISLYTFHDNVLSLLYSLNIDCHSFCFDDEYNLFFVKSNSFVIWKYTRPQNLIKKFIDGNMGIEGQCYTQILFDEGSKKLIALDRNKNSATYYSKEGQYVGEVTLNVMTIDTGAKAPCKANVIACCKNGMVVGYEDGHIRFFQQLPPVVDSLQSFPSSQSFQSTTYMKCNLPIKDIKIDLDENILVTYSNDVGNTIDTFSLYPAAY